LEIQSTPCPTCGQGLDPATGRCASCAEETPAWTLEDSGRERELGLMLFEAEEALARGAAEKAVVLASRVVKERPDSLTARALHERARRELLRGRRRERLEARVREAEGLLESGDAAGADRIVTSALKLIPNHPLALALFGRLKERRQQASTAEAWAEQELERLTQARARRSLDTAQTEMAAGRERAAMMAVRRGLRHAPDDAQLLAKLHEVESVMERAKAGHHAVHAQVRAGLDLLSQGQVDESLKVLRAVLQADPDNVRAQTAVQQVRKAWLRRQAVLAAAPPVPITAAPRPDGPASAVPPPVPSSLPPPIPSTAAPSVSWDDVEAAARGRVVPRRPPAPRPTPEPPPVPAPTSASRPAATPAPSSRPAAAPVTAAAASSPSRALPIGVIVAIVAVLAVVAIAVSRRGSSQPSPAPVAAASSPAATRPTARAEAAPVVGPEVLGPLASADPELRSAVEAVLAGYGRALETADDALLAEARPDLNADERARLLAPFTGALNAATDLRVLDVKVRGDLAAIQLLRTDVIVGGPGGSRDPTEETLRFWRRRDQWVLVR
jgi:tetratricopeptide (TPR) repeat protein